MRIGKQDIHLSAGQVARWAFLPGVLPRLRSFDFNLGFIAWLVAALFVAVRLLPATHPYYTNLDQLKALKIRNVFAEGARHLKWSWKNTDQIVIFTILTVGIILLALQFFTLLLAVLIPAADAASDAISVSFSSLFTTSKPTNDIAYMMMDRVFGIPDLFNSKFAPANPQSIPAYQQALQALFGFYNRALLIVGLLIVFYFVVVVIVETAHSGTPFGKRFSHVYVPIRLVIAVFLLLPVHYGLSAGQHMTLHLAKWGSSLATNSWRVFNYELNERIKSQPTSLVVRPKVPNVASVVEFMHLASACRAAYEMNPINNARQIDMYAVRGAVLSKTGGATLPPAALKLTPGVRAEDVANIVRNSEIKIVAGYQDPARNPVYREHVIPTCGELAISADGFKEVGAKEIYEIYLQTMGMMWADEALKSYGKRMASIYLPPNDPCSVAEPSNFPWGRECTEHPSATYYESVLAQYQASFQAMAIAAIDMLETKDFLTERVETSIIDRGWGGAALWYNQIATLNGSVIAAVYSVPTVKQLPEIMQRTRTWNAEDGRWTRDVDGYDPRDGTRFQNKQEYSFAKMFYQIKKDFNDDSIRALFKGDNTNPVRSFINFLFGSWGLFEMRENSEVHPLAQLSGLGRSLIESSIRNFSLGVAMTGFGSGFEAASQDGKILGSGLKAIGGILFTLFAISLTAGFILFYIVPFMPFMYFMFSVVRWVGSVFQALIAVPLWALAHLRIDGDGIPGKAAANGYYLMLDIFLRPMLTLFGLIAAVSIFSALAVLMNELFDLAIQNLTGAAGKSTTGFSGIESMMNFDSYHNAFDNFFYTVVYAVLMYIMAASSFKLIDAIPNGTMRFIGNNVESFSDSREDPADGIIRYGAIGGSMMTQQAAEGMKEASDSLGGLVGNMAKDRTPPPSGNSG